MNESPLEQPGNRADSLRRIAIVCVPALAVTLWLVHATRGGRGGSFSPVSPNPLYFAYKLIGYLFFSCLLEIFDDSIRKAFFTAILRWTLGMLVGLAVRRVDSPAWAVALVITHFALWWLSLGLVLGREAAFKKPVLEAALGGMLWASVLDLAYLLVYGTFYVLAHLHVC